MPQRSVPPRRGAERARRADAASVGGLAGDLAGVPTPDSSEETGERRHTWPNRSAALNLEAARAPRKLQRRIELQMERDLGCEHVERVRRRPTGIAPGDVDGADAAAREAHQDRDRVVEVARSPCEGEQAASRRRLHPRGRAGERALKADAVAAE